MRSFIIALAPLVFSFLLVAQDTNPAAVHTSLDGHSRYEIVQSPVRSGYLFKLDKYTGDVWQYVEDDPQGAAVWRKMLVRDLPAASRTACERFQLFASGRITRDTFLLDTLSGRVWRAVDDKGTDVWESMSSTK
jgi:hypothetical protein